MAISAQENPSPADSSERSGLPGYDVGRDGKFSLRQLPAGRYRLVYHPKTVRGIDFHTTYYWPQNPGDAIDLAFGQHIDAIEFKTP